MELLNLVNEIRVDELRTTIIDYFWNRFEVGLIDNENDFNYDVQFVKQVLVSQSVKEEKIISIVLFLNMLRYSLLNNSSIVNILVSFQDEARILSDAFNSNL